MNALARLAKWAWSWIVFLWHWFWAGLPGDVRSAIIGAGVGSAITWLLAWYWAPQAPPSEVYPNKEGYAKPMAGLLYEVSKDPNPAKFFFDPPDLQNAFVCEYSIAQGNSGREMMLYYLSKYSMCFSLIQNDKDVYTIRQSQSKSPDMKKTNNGWFCRCNDGAR